LSGTSYSGVVAVKARTESTLSLKYVANIVQWTKVCQRESMQDFVDQNGDLVLDSLRPMEAKKCVGDVVRSTEMVHQSRSHVQQRLPGRPEDRPARCCCNPDTLALN